MGNHRHNPRARGFLGPANFTPQDRFGHELAVGDELLLHGLKMESPIGVIVDIKPNLHPGNQVPNALLITLSLQVQVGAQGGGPLQSLILARTKEEVIEDMRAKGIPIPEASPLAASAVSLAQSTKIVE